MVIKNEKKVKRIANIFAVAAIIIVLGFILVDKGKAEPEFDLNVVGVGKYHTAVALEPGDEAEIDAWNDLFVMVKGKEYGSTPSIWFDVNIGDSLDKLAEECSLKEGYAIINSEVPTEEHDGTTDVIDVPYSKNFFEKYKGEYLDAMIYIGYNKVEEASEEDATGLVNGKWAQVPADEIMDADLIFGFDINGMEDQAVNPGEVIKIIIRYNK